MLVQEDPSKVIQFNNVSLKILLSTTLPETNIFAPENRPSQKETSILTTHFEGPC